MEPKMLTQLARRATISFGFVGFRCGNNGSELVNPCVLVIRPAAAATGDDERLN